ncbi:MAG: Pycsar system effector family protein [Granulosicoccus sp.]
MSKTSKSSKKIALVKEDAKSADVTPSKIGSARGIESMFRNSYRAQLDMIALAAMKANIMISLNGLLVSMLLLSGAYFLGADRLLLIPVTLFLLTCTTAIVFAVLAARPDIDRKKRTIEDFRTDKGILLLFDQFSALSSDDYNDAMREMMQNNTRIYSNMTTHIYTLGCIADKKFTRLYISYNAFIIGLVISVLSLIAVIIFRATVI